MTHELQRKHRPTAFKQVVGQKELTDNLLEMVKQRRVPHCIMLQGPSGTGKTTIARIVYSKLGCGKADLKEMNAASTRGIDDIREHIEKRIGLAPMGGRIRAYILDEAHKLTNDAQNALLKVLEEPPKHAYFCLCTTDPGKLITTIQNRATKFSTKLVKPQEMEVLLNRVAEKENFTLSEAVRDKIIDCANGSPRKALVFLDKILTIAEEKGQLNAVEPIDEEQLSKKLTNILIFEKPKFEQVASILKKLQDNEEGVRRMVLGFANAIMLNNPTKAPKCYIVIQAFRDPYYDCGKSGLSSSCYEVTSR
jgi:DNA polymerase-3 subunit gamma/tau